MRDQFGEPREVCKCGTAYVWRNGMCRACYNYYSDMAADEHLDRIREEEYDDED